MKIFAGTIAALLWQSSADESAALGPPPATEDVGIEPRLGEFVPSDPSFVDHRGRPYEFGDLLDDERPVVLVPAYYRCPMLCGLTIEGVANALARIDLVPGEDFRIVTLSFDPRDGAADAERARARAADLYGEELESSAWPFLAGDEAEIARVTDAVGFRFAFDEATDQYAHASAIFVLSPRGKLTRVLHGVTFPPIDLHLALIEAGEGKVGSVAEQVLLTCYRYDPTERRYGFYVFGFLRITSVFLLITMGAGFFVVIRRDRRRTRAFADDPELQR